MQRGPEEAGDVGCRGTLRDQGKLIGSEMERREKMSRETHIREQP